MNNKKNIFMNIFCVVLVIIALTNAFLLNVYNRIVNLPDHKWYGLIYFTVSLVCLLIASLILIKQTSSNFKYRYLNTILKVYFTIAVFCMGYIIIDAILFDGITIKKMIDAFSFDLHFGKPGINMDASYYFPATRIRLR